MRLRKPPTKMNVIKQMSVRDLTYLSSRIKTFTLSIFPDAESPQASQVWYFFLPTHATPLCDFHCDPPDCPCLLNGRTVAHSAAQVPVAKYTPSQII
jgi:hypothetical protein